MAMSDDTTDSSSPSKDHDVVLLHSRTEDGQGVRALRSRPSKLELTEIRPVKQGKPLMTGEVVRLRPRKESPLLCDVDVEYSSETAAGDHDGPPRVASRAYRSNWDAVFGTARRKPRVLN